eukprot:9404283-Karenia_brevis.AAC.1
MPPGRGWTVPPPLAPHRYGHPNQQAASASATHHDFGLFIDYGDGPLMVDLMSGPAAPLAQALSTCGWRTSQSTSCLMIGRAYPAR